MKFAIFVDGPNLIGSLDKLSVKIDDYQSFFIHVIECAAKEWKKCFVAGSDFPIQLWRVFWYQVGHIDDLKLDSADLEKNFRSSFEDSKELNRSYMALAGKDNPGKNQKELKDIAWDICFNEVKNWYEAKLNNLEGMRRFNFAVRGSTNFIEIIESGHWKVDLLRKRVTEKGIDTSLAVDLVTLVESYDVAIVMSGDADMIPSLNYAKQNGKHVAVVELINGYPPEKKGRQSSTRLKSHSDFVVPIYEMELVKSGIGRKES